MNTTAASQATLTITLSRGMAREVKDYLNRRRPDLAYRTMKDGIFQETIYLYGPKQDLTIIKKAIHNWLAKQEVLTNTIIVPKGARDCQGTP